MISLGIGDIHKNRYTNTRLIKFIIQREAVARMCSQQIKSYDSLVYVK